MVEALEGKFLDLQQEMQSELAAVKADLFAPKDGVARLSSVEMALHRLVAQPIDSSDCR